MNNFDDKIENRLNKIRVREINEDEKRDLWHRISVEKVKLGESKGPSLVFNMQFFKMSIIAGLVLAIVLGTGGVVAASDNARPGDRLFGVDLAVEKIQLKFAGEEKKSELRLKFAGERVAEAEELAEKRKKSEPASQLVVDLSAETVTEIEADVFSNETLIKLETENKHYGYISTKKTRAELVDEISGKYSIEKSAVEAMLDLEIEDRDSRANDREFLNRSSAQLTLRQSEGLNRAISNLEVLIEEEGDVESEAELRAALEDVILILGSDSDIEIRRDGDKIKIESRSESSGKTKIEIRSESKNNGDEDDNENNSGSNNGSDDDEEDTDDNSGSNNDNDEEDGEDEDAAEIEIEGSLEVR